MRAVIVAVIVLASTQVDATVDDPCKVIGTWDGVADNDAGQHYTIVLELVEHDGKLVGTLHWKGLPGEEHVQGTVNCGKRTVTLFGTTANGALTASNYSLALGEGGKQLSGRWTCPRGDCIDGKLAVKLR